MEIEVVDRELALNVLADRDRTLLAVDDLEVWFVLVILVLTYCPIEDVERKLFADSFHYCRPLLVLVDKLPLEGRTDVESTSVARYAALLIVPIAFDQVPDGDLVKFNSHLHSWRFLIRIRAYC